MNELPDILDFVAMHPPFDRLDDETLQRVCGHVEISYARAGTQLLDYDAHNDELFLVRSGAVGLYDVANQLVDKRAEGELFGYPSLLTGQATRFAVRAVEDTLLYHIDANEFRRLRVEHPAFDRFFSAALVARIESGLAPGDRRTPLVARRIADLMSSPAVTIDAHATIAEAATLMAERRVSALPVTADGGLAGILTDRDLRNRVVAPGRPYATPITAVMTPEPISIGPQDSAFTAQLTMTNAGVPHLPVTDGGEVVGVLTLSDLLTAIDDEPVHFVGALRRTGSVDALVAGAARRLELFVKLVDSGLPASDVEKVMTSVADAVTRRLLRFAEERLGPPPLRYAWLAFGSQARAEQTGKTDQDNGLIFASEPDDAQSRYFADLAEFVCTGLDRAGFVLCPGEVMAMNPQWRMSLAGWQKHFCQWIDAPEPKALMFASIFFDLRAVDGHAPLVDDLRKAVFARARDNSIFLRFMAVNALEFRPPVSFFRQFILESDGEHNEGLNLKQRGVVPIVSMARLRALELGIERPATLERLALAVSHNANAREELDSLRDALELIGRLRHAHQADSIRRGEAPTNLIAPAALSPLTRRHLKAAFLTVRSAQQSLERRYSMS